MAINNNFIRKALNLFSIRPVNGDNKNPGHIEPDNPILKKGWGKTGLHLPNYNPLMALWNWYLQETLDTSETLQNRKNRYQDIDFAIKANTLIKAAVELFADEATQCDIGGCPIRVKAKKEIQAYIAKSRP